ncbi:MAG: hypothetical protein AB1762_14565 [Gemmatimonadota bacterium]
MASGISGASAEGFPRIVALISDGPRAALARLLTEQLAPHPGTVLFASDTEELSRAVTAASFVLVEGSRLGELTARGRVREGPHSAAGRALVGELGEVVLACLDRLPGSTASAWRGALHAPRAWSVKRVAHAAGVSTRQLVRHCAAANCVVSPKLLLLAARLAAAQTLLQGPRSLNAAVLARACGWVDARSFRMALRRAGLTSVRSLQELSGGHATVSDLVLRIAGAAPNAKGT